MEETKVEIQGGVFHFYFDFSASSQLHEVSLSSFQITNATLCTAHKEIIIGKSLGFHSETRKMGMLVDKSSLNKILFGIGENCHLNFVGGISKRGKSIFRYNWRE